MLALRSLLLVGALAVSASLQAAPPGYRWGARRNYPPNSYTWNAPSYRPYPPGYGGYGYNFPWWLYVNPPVASPYDPYITGVPSYTGYRYTPVSPFVLPDGTLNGVPGLPANPPVVPQDPVFELEQRLNEQNRNPPLTKEERLPLLKPSTPEAQQRSLRHYARGDQQFKDGRYHQAAQEFRAAINDAEDLPDNYFRLGYSLAAMRRYDDAVDQFKYGLLLDQTWPQRGESLEQLFGPDNKFERTALVHRVSDWVRADLRNPNRIFLFGVMLYFDGNKKDAQSMFEAAIRVAGEEPYLTAFTKEPSNDQSAPVDQPAPAANPGPLQNGVVQGNQNRNIPAPPPAGIERQGRFKNPPQSTPAPPPANPLPVPSTPPSVGPAEEEPVPRRESPPSDSDEPEKIPDLHVPELPTPSGESNVGI
jgi:tetratricopeptide (TPR) repeat protein